MVELVGFNHSGGRIFDSQIIPARTTAATCGEAALLCGTRRRASSMVRREPYQ
jgi:hypothetical protein